MKAKKTKILGAIVVLVALMGTLSVRQLRVPRPTAERRGAALALGMGCVTCHGPGATGGVVNPGSKDEEVPAWDGGNAMMYVNNEEEIREWILYGHPKRHRHEHSNPQHGANEPDREGRSSREAARPLLDMPAYKNVLSGRELDDLVAYYKAVAKYYDMPDSARAGYSVARRNACFACHGAGGLVGAHNPRSFKGYIPPWRGADFREMVKNEAELYRWIREGRIERFDSNPLARFFTRRQVVKMPAYEKRLSEEEMKSVVAYIHWLENM